MTLTTRDVPATFPTASTLDLGSARARFASGLPVTVTRTAPDWRGRSNMSSWSYACILSDNGTTMVRAPGRGERYMACDSYHNQEAVSFARALLDPSYEGGYVANPFHSPKAMVGVYMLAPSACSECGDTLVTPDSIAHGYGPDCGGRYAARNARAESKRNIARNAWSDKLGSAPVVSTPTPNASGATCNGRCSLDQVCPVCG